MSCRLCSFFVCLFIFCRLCFIFFQKVHLCLWAIGGHELGTLSIWVHNSFTVYDNSWPLKVDNFSEFQNVISDSSHQFFSSIIFYICRIFECFDFKGAVYFKIPKPMWQYTFAVINQSNKQSDYNLSKIINLLNDHPASKKSGNNIFLTLY